MDHLTGSLRQEFQYVIPPPVRMFVHAETGETIDEARYLELQAGSAAGEELPYEFLETRQATGMVEPGWYGSFFPTGEIRVEGRYWQGEFDGTWTTYDITGNKSTVRVYERGKRVHYGDYISD